jgi:uncharacterized membrane protein YfcA
MMDMMISAVSAGLPLKLVLLACGVTLFAGFVKGAVGFAMPLIMVSAFSAFLPIEVALAGLILPTVVTNLGQALRQGVGPAIASARGRWRFILGTVVFIGVSAPFVNDIPRTAYLLLLGVPVTVFAGLQFAGVALALRLQHQRRAEWALGIVGGIYGGVSGIWGPPLLVYLLSVGTHKVEMIRVQGVVFLIGAVALLAAHLRTGVADGPSLGFSALLVVPAVLGMVLGNRLQDRLDQQLFRRWTQGLLVVTGLNLIRQALMA